MYGWVRYGLLVGAATAAVPACAGPYTVSSPDAATLWRIKVQAERKEAPGKATLILPKLTLTMPVAPGLDVAIKGQLRAIDRAGARREIGFGDVEVKAKWRLLRAGRVAFAVEPLLSLPTGDRDRGLGDGRAGIALPLILGYKAGGWELGGEAGYAHVFGSADHKGYAGLLVVRHVAPRLRLGTELVVETNNIARSPADTRMSAGFKLKIGTNSGLQGLVGRTLHTANHRATNRFKIAYEVAW